MSKQRNKRNTRRGRAKRWRMSGGGWVHSDGDFVYRSDGLWFVERRVTHFNGAESAFSVCDALRSRAAAMRAAEHLARRR